MNRLDRRRFLNGTLPPSSYGAPSILTTSSDRRPRGRSLRTPQLMPLGWQSTELIRFDFPSIEGWRGAAAGSMVICIKGVTGTSACRVISNGGGRWRRRRRWRAGGSSGVIYRERRVRINFTRRVAAAATSLCLLLEHEYAARACASLSLFSILTFGCRCELQTTSINGIRFGADCKRKNWLWST